MRAYDCRGLECIASVELAGCQVEKLVLVNWIVTQFNP